MDHGVVRVIKPGSLPAICARKATPRNLYSDDLLLISNNTLSRHGKPVNADYRG
jgi:hypothetical protein